VVKIFIYEYLFNWKIISTWYVFFAITREITLVSVVGSDNKINKYTSVSYTKKTHTISRVGLMVPKAGIEPARPEGLWILSFMQAVFVIIQVDIHN